MESLFVRVSLPACSLCPGFWKFFKKQVIRIAISPNFFRFERSNDRMFRQIIMFRGVTVRRIVTAAYVSARHAKPEMDPPTADLQTVFAALRARLNITDHG